MDSLQFCKRWAKYVKTDLVSKKLIRQSLLFPDVLGEILDPEPDQGSNPWPLDWECRVLATAPSGKSPKISLLDPALTNTRVSQLKHTL